MPQSFFISTQTKPSGAFPGGANSDFVQSRFSSCLNSIKADCTKPIAAIAHTPQNSGSLTSITADPLSSRDLTTPLSPVQTNSASARAVAAPVLVRSWTGTHTRVHDKANHNPWLSIALFLVDMPKRGAK